MTPEDLIDIRAFKLKIVSNMSRVAFQQMRDAFRDGLEISSLYIIIHKMSILSGILPKWFDCCVNTCIAYTSQFETNSSCPLCGEQRFSANGEPRRVFCYLPLIPRLQKYFSNIKIANELGYRAEYTKSIQGISDVFDGEHYRNLCRKKVTIDGREMPYRYFSQDTDIAFATCLDGYLLYKCKRGGPSATPILIKLYNLPPEVRIHMHRLLCLGAIPGPKSPKRPETFLYPLDQERVDLAIGVKTFNCRTKAYFDLRAYNLFTLGDIIAIEKFLNLKGHNGKCPCRSCQITAVATINKGHTYYVPLGRPLPATNTWDPRELPMRKHEHWEIVTQKIANAPNKTKQNEIAMRCGIKGMPALRRVGSMDYARGIPWDYMHLLLENVIQNLVKLWMGRYKGLDSGKEDFIIPDEIWKQIAKETAASVAEIPAEFVCALGNPYDDQINLNAEGWSFWFMFIAPILLQGRLKATYYKHFCLLVDIMKTATQFSLTYAEIDALEEKIIKWVEEFEW